MMSVISWLKNSFPGLLKLYIYRRDQRKITNLYKSNFSKRALLSYLVTPFLDRSNFSHNHFEESRLIAKTLHTLQYDVDVVSWNNHQRIDYKKYDLIFGLGEPIENVLTLSNHPVVVTYATGSHPRFQNEANERRLKQIPEFQRKDLEESIRLAKEWPASIKKSSALLVVGNQVTLSSFLDYRKTSIFSIPVPAIIIFDYKEIIREKNFENSKKHFLFISSKGLFHKGLDLLLVFFTDNPDYHLHILAPIKEELGFMNIFADQLSKPNIHIYGFVNLNSDFFKELLLKCAFIILPSCAEGQSGAVINAMVNGGLVPIVTREVGIDIDSEGILIEELTDSAINKAVNKALTFSEYDLRLISFKIGERFSKENSAERFQKVLISVIKTSTQSYEGNN